MAYTMRTARLAAGKTQAEMAVSLGVSRSLYRKMEQHPEDLTPEQAQRFSRAAGIDIDRINFFAEKLYLK